MSPEDLAKKYTNDNLLQAQVILDLGFPWNSEEYGDMYIKFIDNLDILKFLRYLDIPFAEDTFTEAVSISCLSFDMIKWLHEEGCPWNEETFEKAMYSDRNDRMGLLKWMIKEGCPREPGCLADIIYNWDNFSLHSFIMWVKEGCQ